MIRGKIKWGMLPGNYHIFTMKSTHPPVKQYVPTVCWVIYHFIRNPPPPDVQLFYLPGAFFNKPDYLRARAYILVSFNIIAFFLQSSDLVLRQSHSPASIHQFHSLALGFVFVRDVTGSHGSPGVSTETESVNSLISISHIHTIRLTLVFIDSFFLSPFRGWGCLYVGF